MMWLWIELFFLAFFVDGALLVKWALDRDFPTTSPKDGTR